MWVDRMLHPHCDFELWPHPWPTLMSTMVSQITSLAIVYSTVYSGPDQRKHQSSVSLAFAKGTHRWSVNFTPKGPVMQKMLPFDNIFMWPLIFKVKFGKSCNSGMGCPIDMEQKGCEPTECWTHVVTSTLTLPMTLTLNFQCQILKYM